MEMAAVGPPSYKQYILRGRASAPAISVAERAVRRAVLAGDQ